jgi:hypothetical protein
MGPQATSLLVRDADADGTELTGMGSAGFHDRESV